MKGTHDSLSEKSVFTAFFNKKKKNEIEMKNNLPLPMFMAATEGRLQAEEQGW